MLAPLEPHKPVSSPVRKMPLPQEGKGMSKKTFPVLGKKVEYVGNPTPKMLEEMQQAFEDLAMGKTTIKKMAEEFEAKERRKIN